MSGTERALVVVASPPEYLSRKGILRSRTWLKEQGGSMEVQGGDSPRCGEGTVAAFVLPGDVTNVPRVKQLQQVAVEAQQRREELADDHDADLRGLIDSDGDSELESLF